MFDLPQKYFKFWKFIQVMNYLQKNLIKINKQYD